MRRRRSGAATSETTRTAFLHFKEHTLVLYVFSDVWKKWHHLQLNVAVRGRLEMGTVWNVGSCALSRRPPGGSVFLNMRKGRSLRMAAREGTFTF